MKLNTVGKEFICENKMFLFLLSKIAQIKCWQIINLVAFYTFIYFAC